MLARVVPALLSPASTKVILRGKRPRGEQPARRPSSAQSAALPIDPKTTHKRTLLRAHT